MTGLSFIDAVRKTQGNPSKRQQHAKVQPSKSGYGRRETDPATDAEMTPDLDASIPWNLNGPRPDFRVGACHYNTADRMFCRVAARDCRLTRFMLHYKQIINEGRHLVKNVCSNVEKWRFWNGCDEAPMRPHDYNFLAGLFILCCNLHNMEQRYTGRLYQE